MLLVYCHVPFITILPKEVSVTKAGFVQCYGFCARAISKLVEAMNGIDNIERVFTALTTFHCNHNHITIE